MRRSPIHDLRPAPNSKQSWPTVTTQTNIVLPKVETKETTSPASNRLLPGGGSSFGTAALLWLLLFNRLRVDWSVNPQYSYGWFVPMLGLGLLWRRWNFRPAPAPPAHSGIIGLAVACLLLTLLPVRLIQEANPEWRLILWLQAVQTVLLSLCAVFYLGGWPWVKHFVFPVGFLLLAVPWPTGLETAVIQNLMRLVTSLTVEVLDWMNIPAIQQGSIIEIASGVVGVDEACSGVRSLQTSLLVSLFVGELYQFNKVRRGLLLGAGFLLAIIANIGRTTFLVWVASSRGFAKMHQWHDGAGVAVVFVVLTGLGGLALWLRPKSTAPEPLSPVWALRRIPRGWLFALTGWLVAVEVGTEFWYRAHESDLAENVHWSIAWPINEAQFQDLEIGETALAMLRCTGARGVGWQDANGNQLKLFFLKWKPGNNSAQLAKSHRPEICLPGAGLKLVKDLGTHTALVEGVELPFHRYVFQQQDKTLYVFYCLWEDRSPRRHEAVPEDGSMASRLAAVRAGKRNLGQQVLQVAVHGPTTPGEALTALETELKQLVRKSATPGS
jgi:exosortase